MFRYLLYKILFKRLSPPTPKYTHGTIGNGSRARKDKNGKVEILLWKAGERGHTEDFWHIPGDGWAETFKAE